MKPFLHVVMLENDTAKVSATDDGWFTIRCEGAVDLTVSMRPDAADRICTALGQLLTDRRVCKQDAAGQLRGAIADQVERAELLADASPPSAADMSEGELILGRRVPPQ